MQNNSILKARPLIGLLPEIVSSSPCRFHSVEKAHALSAILNPFNPP